MDDYPFLSVKRDPETGALAQRSTFEADSNRAWYVMSMANRNPPHPVSYADIEHWDDLVQKDK